MKGFGELSVKEYMNRAWEAGSSEESIEILMRAALMADRAGDAKLGHQARARLVEESHSADAAYEMLAGFGRMLHSSEWTGSYMEMWCYKWVFHSLLEVASISLDQIWAVFADFEQRYKDASLGSSAVEKIRLEIALGAGQIEQAKAIHDIWKDDPKKAGSDCRACDLDSEVVYLLNLGDVSEAIEVAQPIIAGTERCASVPQSTFGALVIPALEAGEYDLAGDLLRRGYPLVSSSRGYLNFASMHTIAFACSGHWSRAINGVGSRMAWLGTTRNDDKRFWSLLACESAFDAAWRAGESVTVVSGIMPAGVHEADGLYDTQRMRDWFGARVDELALKFDTRNSTAKYTDVVSRCRKLIGRGITIDLDSDDDLDEDEHP